MSDKEGVKKERSRSRSPLRTKSPDNESEDEAQQSDLDDTNNSNLDEKSAKDEPNANCVEKPSKKVNKKTYRYILVENLPSTNCTRKHLAALFGVLMGPDRPEKVYYEVVRDKDNNPTGKYIFKFSDEAERQYVFKSFQYAKFEGKFINPQLDPEIAKDFLLREFRYLNKSDNFKKTEWLTKVKSPNLFVKQVVLPPEPLPDHTFGLSLQYLKTHNIDPPLRRKICVLHLCNSVDKAKIREVFSLAGQVTDVRVVSSKANYPDARAFVEFDHPVEAVQAISMFHNQKLNGKKMIVKMDNICNRVLPRGLESIGPGLGLYGEPMKGVRVTMEIKSLGQKIEKELANKEPNQNTDNTPNPDNQLLAQLTALLSKQTQGNSQSQNMANNGQNPSPYGSNFGQNAPNFASNTPNFGQNTPNFGTNTPCGPNASNFEPNASNFGTNPSNFGTIPSNFGQNVPFGSNTSNFGSNISNFGSESNFEQYVLNRNQSMSNMGSSNDPKIPTFTQNAVPNINTQNWNTQSTAGMQSGQQYGSDGSHYMQQHISNDRREFDVKSNKRDKDSGSRFESNKKKPDTLVFSYLPPSVNGQSLNLKMNEVGELVFAEVTGQGRAIVRFKNPNDADKCIKLFDRSKVDGQIISVKYL